MQRNTRFLVTALVVSTAFSYYLFASPSLWDSAPAGSPSHQLYDTTAPLTVQAIEPDTTAVSAERISLPTPDKINAPAPINPTEMAIDHDFNVVSAEVLALEQQYREGKLPISASDEVDFSPDAAVTPEVAELERQYRAGEIPILTIDDIDTTPNAPVTPETAELERQYRAGETPRYSLDEIDFSPDAAITPEVAELEAQYRQRETGQRGE
ncbi:hypothetical protein HMY34_14735 [Thiothrix subterranea]|uniref:hypothetical protein n=1 Tax=Thiothrix subterranea TaxID=2735563 RepID=UPI00192BAC06|nr:hypothetical protein [Thiothrix subterranea]QQZ29914.1 hypothetical protein HMY34_14735 [Thiothrix subterranea]